jgi:two-component system, NarL family, invasion response regulator UvrY
VKVAVQWFIEHLYFVSGAVLSGCFVLRIRHLRQAPNPSNTFFMYTIAMADDHVMLREGLANIISNFGPYAVVLQVANGKALVDALEKMQTLPDLALLDISMPIMNGFATAAHLQKTFPTVKVLALSMMDNESAIITMIKNGARGYVLKDADPAELRQAIADVLEKGYHYSEMVTGRLIHAINREGANENTALANAEKLTDRERMFLAHCCTELTYKEIADKMGVSPRTVDGYRDVLFEKLGVKSRVGLAMFAVRQGIAGLTA